MKRLVFTVGACVSVIFTLAIALPVLAQTDASLSEPTIEFFYSATCPHCQAEQAFLDGVAEQYPSVTINRYAITDTQHHGLLRNLAAKTGAERYLGTVPLTFIGNTYIVGFQSAETTGSMIKQALKKQFDIAQDATSSATSPPTSTMLTATSILGFTIDPAQMSLPLLAVLLGILDGFNVCSLGALVLILGLVLTLRSRKKIALYGGAFLLTTAVIYGLLIVLWHQLFSLLAPFVVVMEMLLATLGIAGGIYFLREYLRFRRGGITCSSEESPFVTGASRWVRRMFEQRSGVLTAALAIAAFAAVVAVVEFPCSAAVPVMFAGILAKAQLSGIVWISYIALFVLFYLLDEIIIFAIAVYKLHLWLASPKFTLWAALIEGVALFAIGAWYFVALVVQFL